MTPGKAALMQEEMRSDFTGSDTSVKGFILIKGFLWKGLRITPGERLAIGASSHRGAQAHFFFMPHSTRTVYVYLVTI